jgi:hypothetical protein
MNQYKARFICFLGRLDDLNLGDACLPLCHVPSRSSDTTAVIALVSI